MCFLKEEIKPIIERKLTSQKQIWKIIYYTFDDSIVTFINREWFLIDDNTCIFITFEYHHTIQPEYREKNILQCIKFRIKGTYESYSFDSIEEFISYIISHPSLCKIIARPLTLDNVFQNEKREMNENIKWKTWVIQEYNHSIAEQINCLFV